MLVALSTAVAATAGMLLFFFGLSQIITQTDEVEERLSQFAGRHPGIKEQPKGKKESAIRARLGKAIAKQAFTQNIARELARANLKLTVAEYLVANALTTFFGAISGFALGRGLLTGLVGLAVGFFAPRWFVRRRQKARLRAFNDQLGDTITLLANPLRNGHSLLQSIDIVARGAPQPTAEEFRRVVHEVDFGLSPQEALANLVRRISSEDLDLVVAAINIQHEVGGNLPQVLETIGNTIQERVQLRGEIETIVAQQRYSGYVLAALPILLSLFLYLLNPSYMTPMFSGIYLFLPIGGIILTGIGFMVIRKIVTTEI